MTGTAFLVGARGFVGSHAVRAFLTAGWRVHVFGPAMRPDLLADLAGGFDETEGSVEDGAAMADAMQVAQPDVVVSFAAFSAGSGGLARSGEADADRAFDVNVTGLRRTFDAARATGVPRVLWSSSTTLYGPAALYDEPVDESAPYRPQLVYGLTKAMGEQLSLFYRDRHGLETVAVRLPLVIGPGLWYHGAAGELMKMLRAAGPGESFSLKGPDVPVDLMYATDCAEALVAIAAHGPPPPERLNVNGFTATFADVARAAERAVPGYAVEVATEAPPVVYPLITTALVERTVGYRPRFDLDAAVRDLLDKEGDSRA